VTKGNVHDSKKFSPIVREVSEGYDIAKATMRRIEKL
jgi:hypothetical protein